MLETANSAITLAKEWRKGGDLPYRLMAAVASVLVLVSFYRQERPSDLASEFFTWLGMEAVARWFGPESPPFITDSSSTLQQGLLFALPLLLIWMIVAPVGHEFHQEVPTGSFSKRLMSGRAPATFWLLLLGLLQQGFDSASLQDVLKSTGGVFLGVFTISAAFAALFLIVHWLHPNAPYRPKPHLSFSLPWKLSVATLAAGLAVSLVPIGIPIFIIIWLSAWESQRLKDERRERVRREVERLQANRDTQQPSPEPTTPCGCLTTDQAPTAE
ncbi:hypothetical protein [Nocardiopsis tropica]|uniref:Uncharacterized protein n=1 Tax=Nocardiopsis tropica TaxID=109330 RepID=A0ABV1ZZT4_9ACTN